MIAVSAAFSAEPHIQFSGALDPSSPNKRDRQGAAIPCTNADGKELSRLVSSLHRPSFRRPVAVKATNAARSGGITSPKVMRPPDSLLGLKKSSSQARA